MQFINLQAQYRAYKDEIDEAIKSVLDSSQYVMGSDVQALERELQEFVGVKHAIACANGTDALVLALRAFDIGAGDEVIVPAFSFIASASCVSLVGAKPVFVDVNPDTFNIDVTSLENSFTSKTKAVIAVGLYGLMPDLDRLIALCAKHKVKLIEDGAQSFGASLNGVRSLARADVGCTSFFPAKPLGAYGDGGALFTNDDLLAERLRMVLNHGSKIRYQHEILGTNSRLDTMQAAILRVKLRHYQAEIQVRQQRADTYTKWLSNIAGLRCPVIPQGYQSVWAQYTLVSDFRDELIADLQKAQIPTAVHYPVPIHLQPLYQELGYKVGSFPVAEDLSSKVVSLPMSAFLTPAEQEKVIMAIKARGVRIHPTAEVSIGVSAIGRGSMIWNNAQVREGVSIGTGTIVSKDVYIDKNVSIGSNCKIQNSVSVYSGVTIQDDVFVGPNACFTNDKVPRAFNTEWKTVETLVERGASIGANATIVCGVKIGEYAMVGAGALVTRDVPPYTLVLGSPAKPVAEIDKMGNKVRKL